MLSLPHCVVRRWWRSGTHRNITAPHSEALQICTPNPHDAPGFTFRPFQSLSLSLSVSPLSSSCDAIRSLRRLTMRSLFAVTPKAYAAYAAYA